MKQFILLLFINLTTIGLYAQMSDSQVIDYVKTENAKGRSQDQIGAALLQRGVTRSQLERIKNQVEQEQSIMATQNVSSNQFATREMNVNQEVTYLDTITISTNVFGKNIFNKKNLTFAPDLNLPTPLNYRLAAGDEIVIDIWGASQVGFRKTITPDGIIYVENVGPVFLSGLTINEATSVLKRKLGEVYSGVDEDDGASSLKISLGNIRSIQVNVIGEVIAPGTYTLTSLSSVFNALYAAGGINDIGSLREINVYRNNVKISTIDVYEYLLYGKTRTNINLQEGDVIIVPTYKLLVKVEGEIKRPMYYEMKSGETINTLIDYAGGFQSGAYQDEFTVSRKSGFYDKIFTVDKLQSISFSLNNGDVINIKGGLNLYANRVTISGQVFRPGDYEVGDGISTVSDLIKKAGGPKEDAFLGRVLLTRQKDDLTFETLSLNLTDILSGKANDISLRKNDELNISSNTVEEDFGPLVIYGLVAKPGTYSYAENTTVKDLIVKAGGLLSSASTMRIDISRRIVDPTSVVSSSVISETFNFSLEDGLIANGKEEFILKPYDQVYIRKSPGYHEQRNITITGEVLFPGAYTLENKAERISDIILKSGGLTPQAYTKGAKIMRRLSDREVKDRIESIKRLDASISSDSISDNTFQDIEYSTVGIELDLAIKKPYSEYDIVLRAGDQIIIPEFDNTVRIMGAVMNPNTVVYKKGKSLNYYIEQAGGYAENARKKNSYIVYMNGTTAKGKAGGNNLIQPGCEIIIPTKEQKRGISLGEKIAIASSVTSMASVIALLINNLTK